MEDGEAVSSTRVRRAIAAGEMEKKPGCCWGGGIVWISRRAWQGIGPQAAVPNHQSADSPQMVLPRLGVYATMARVNGKVYAGVTNIGVRPTVEKEWPRGQRPT